MPAIDLDQSKLADLVRETRQRLELSQAKFAAKLGVSFQSINRWENGRTKPLPIAQTDRKLAASDRRCGQGFANQILFRVRTENI